MSTLSNIESTVEVVLRHARRSLSAQRYAHVRSVTDLSAALASRFDVPVANAVLAAAAHDLDRERSEGQLLALCNDWSVPMQEVERRTPVLLHAPVAAERLRRCYAVTDEKTIAAVRHHTLGSPLLAERPYITGLLLFVADFCEPLRSWPSRRVREEILGQSTLAEMAVEIIRRGIERWGAVEEPTAQLYARLLETNRRD